MFKSGRPPVYKDDFTIHDDGVPVCHEGHTMRRDGIESIKGRTVHLVMADNPRLFNDPPRSSEKWKLEYNARTSAERCNKREKLDYKLEDGRSDRWILVGRLIIPRAYFIIFQHYITKK